MKLPIYFTLIFTTLLLACQTEKEPEFSDFIGTWYQVKYEGQDTNRFAYPKYFEFTFFDDSSIYFCSTEFGSLPPRSKNSYETINFNKIGDSLNIEIVWNDTMTFNYGFYHRIPEHYPYLPYQNTDTTEEGTQRFHRKRRIAESIRMDFKGQPATYEEIKSMWNLENLKEEGTYEEYDKVFREYASDLN